MIRKKSSSVRSVKVDLQLYRVRLIWVYTIKTRIPQKIFSYLQSQFYVKVTGAWKRSRSPECNLSVLEEYAENHFCAIFDTHSYHCCRETHFNVNFWQADGQTDLQMDRNLNSYVTPCFKEVWQKRCKFFMHIVCLLGKQGGLFLHF